MKTVDLGSYCLAYEESGSGFPVVMTSSLYCDHEMFAFHAKALSQHYRVLNIDNPGHGESGCPGPGKTLEDYASDLLRFLDLLKIKKAHWVGLSVGGMFGLRVALLDPSRISKLVIMNSCAESEPENTKQLFLTTARAYASHQGAEDAITKVMSRFFCAKTHEKRPEIVDYWKKKILSRKDRSGFLHLAEAVFSRRGLLNELSDVQARCLVIAGKDDVARPAHESENLHAGLLGSKLEVLENAAHISALDQPQKTLDLISSWLSHSP